MSIMVSLAVMSCGLTCFSIKYTLGKDKNKTQKYPPYSLTNVAVIFANYIGLTVYR